MHGATLQKIAIAFVVTSLMVAMPAASALDLSRSTDPLPNTSIQTAFVEPLATEESGDLGYDPRDDDSEWSLEALYGTYLTVTHGLTEDGDVAFHIHTPNELTGDSGHDNFNLLLDLNNNGRANFQVSYRAWEENPWVYQEPFWSGDSNNPRECGWRVQDLPSSIVPTKVDDDHYVISVPLPFLLNSMPDYRYAVQNINHGPQTPLDANDAQVHMTIPETRDLYDLDGGQTDQDGNPCWFSSANYQQATFGLWNL